MLADLDGDNRNELILAGSDGFVHAIRRNGSELPGWPVRGDRPPLHLGQRAFESGEVSGDVGGAMLGSLAVADVNRDGVPEVFADDLEGKVYGWRADGDRFFTEEANPAFSGKPLQPFVNVAQGSVQPHRARLHRLTRRRRPRRQRGLRGDRRRDGPPCLCLASERLAGSGFPVLVVDPTKVQSIDPQTHQVTFKADSGSLSKERSSTRRRSPT